MKVTYYGHSCFAVELAGRTLLFDPFITPNEKAKHIDVRSLRPDYILVSHGHADHIADAADIAKRTGATVISNFEIVGWLSEQGATNGHPMNHGGRARFDFGTVKYVNAIHSSSLPDGAYGGNPGGFVVESADGSFYYAGDTALTMDMQLIGESARLDFAALPIGDTFTMGIDDAIQAARLVRTSKVLGVHFDTFPPIQINHQEALDKFQKAGLSLTLLQPGGTAQF